MPNQLHFLLHFPFWLLLLLPLSTAAQGVNHLSDLLETALRYDSLNQYWDRDSLGQPLIRAFVSNHKVPSQTPLTPWGRVIDTWSGRPPQAQPSHLLVWQKVKINGEKARVHWLYDHRIKVRLRLRKSPQGWRVSQALIKGWRGGPGARRRQFNFIF